MYSLERAIVFPSFNRMVYGVLNFPSHQCGFKLQQITPLRGPREGGTLVTIRGENLGLDFREIQGNVKVAEVDCTPIREGYIPAEQ